MQKNDMLFDYIAQCVKPQGKSDLMMLMEYDRWSSDWESGKQCVGDNGNLFDLVGYLQSAGHYVEYTSIQYNSFT